MPDEKEGHKRGSYVVFSAKDKAKIAKYASENGVTASLKHFKRTREFTDLKEPTVRGWVKTYRYELSSLGVTAVSIPKMPERKRGRPLILGKDLESQVRQFILELKEHGSPVSTAIVVAAAKGIAEAKDPAILAENNGPINLTRGWRKRVLGRMGFVKRKCTTSARKLMPEEYEDVKTQFLEDIETVAKMKDIPPQLVINWDQTAIKYVPVSLLIQEKKGAKSVEIIGTDDKRQITATVAGTMSREFLPAQLICGGKTPACLPKVDFPTGWSITFTPNHWANENTVLSYVNNILLPYITKVRKNLHLSTSHAALVIIDHFKGHFTEKVFNVLEQNNVVIVDVPANCTAKLQPMDLSVNKLIKDHMRSSFQEWYAHQVKLKNGNHEPVDLRLSLLKPLGVRWFINAFLHIQANPSIINNGFVKAGIKLS